MQDFRAPRWLIGGNAQTIWPAMFSRRFIGAPPVFQRERWTAPDGDFIDVDFQRADFQGVDFQGVDFQGVDFQADDGRPLLVMFHGLEGSSASHYSQAFAHWARAHGWRFAMPHFRGCSGSPLPTRERANIRSRSNNFPPI